MILEVLPILLSLFWAGNLDVVPGKNGKYHRNKTQIRLTGSLAMLLLSAVDPTGRTGRAGLACPCRLRTGLQRLPWAVWAGQSGDKNPPNQLTDPRNVCSNS